MEVSKEELVAENAALKLQIQILEQKEAKLLEEFAVAFGWYSKQGMYTDTIEIKKRSWSAVFVHIGRLLAVDTAQRMQDQLGDIDSRLSNFISYYERINKKETE